MVNKARTSFLSRHVLQRGLTAGTLVAASVSLVTLLNRRNVIAGLTSIPEVCQAAYGVLPLVLTCQVLKGLAYPVSGALMGFLDWGANAFSMVAAQACAISLVLWWHQRLIHQSSPKTL